jgi:hypothetical protein
MGWNYRIAAPGVSLAEGYWGDENDEKIEVELVNRKGLIGMISRKIIIAVTIAIFWQHRYAWTLPSKLRYIDPKRLYLLTVSVLS